MIKADIITINTIISIKSIYYYNFNYYNFNRQELYIFIY